MDLPTLKELHVEDLRQFGLAMGPARRIVNVLSRHRTEDLPAVVSPSTGLVACHAFVAWPDSPERAGAGAADGEGRRGSGLDEAPHRRQRPRHGMHLARPCMPAEADRCWRAGQVRPPQSQAAVEEALRPRAQVDWLDKVTMLACSCPCALSALTPMVLVPQAEHPAVVRFIGRVGKKRGLYVGLELLDYSEGLPEAVRSQLSAG